MFVFLILVFTLATILFMWKATELTRQGQKGRSFYLLALACASASLIFIQMAMIVRLVPEVSMYSQIPTPWKTTLAWTSVVLVFSLILGAVMMILDDIRYSILGKDKPVSR